MKKKDNSQKMTGQPETKRSMIFTETGALGGDDSDGWDSTALESTNNEDARDGKIGAEQGRQRKNSISSDQ